MHRSRETLCRTDDPDAGAVQPSGDQRGLLDQGPAQRGGPRQHHLSAAAQRLDHRHGRHPAAGAAGAGELSVPDDRQLPAARAVRGGGHELLDTGQRAQPLTAHQHLHGGRGDVPQPRGALVTGPGGEFGHPIDGRRQRSVLRPVHQFRRPRGCLGVLRGAQPGGGRARRDLTRRAGRPVPRTAADPAGAGAHPGEPGDQAGGVGGVGAAAERAHRTVGARLAHDRQPGERLLGQHHPPPPLREPGAPVVRRGVRHQQPQLAGPGFQGVGALDVVHPLGQRHHLLHPSARVRPGEVLADPPAQIGGGPDVEHLVARSAEQINPGPSRKSLGQSAFRALGVGDPGQIGAQFAQCPDALVADPFDECVQHVDGGPGVVEGTVGGLGGRADQPGQGGQPDAGCLLAAEHPPGQSDRAQHRRTWPVQTAALRRRAQEPDVEAGVVRHQDRAAGELQEHRQHRGDGGGVAHHRGGDPGEFDDLRRDRALRVHQGGELADHLAAADLDRADLGDRVVAAVRTGLGAAAGGLQVDDDERDVPQRRFSGVERRAAVEVVVEVAEAQLGLSLRGTGRHGSRR